MLRLAIITNPGSYRNRLWPLAAQALRKAAPGAVFFEAGSVAALAAIAAEVESVGFEVVAIAGGDGTVQHVVTALDRACGGKLPLLALLGGGAYDSLAALGGSGDAEVRLRRLSVALASGVPMLLEPPESRLFPFSLLQPGGREFLRVVERDTLRVGGACGFRLGVGLPVVFVEAVYQAGGGRSAGLRTLVRAASSSMVKGPFARALYRPLPVTVWVDGDEWPALPLYGMVCSTVEEAGLGLRPFRRALEQPGFFQALGLTAGPRAFALELPRLLLGLPARRDRLLDSVAERVELRPSLRHAPDHSLPHSGTGPGGLRYLLDGELLDSPGPLTVGLGPRIRVVRT